LILKRNKTILTVIAILLIAVAMIHIMLYKPNIFNDLTGDVWEGVRTRIAFLLENPDDKSMAADSVNGSKRKSSDTAAVGQSLDISSGSDQDGQSSNVSGVDEYLINEHGKTVLERIAVPEGFQRVKLEEGSFGEYLRNLPLKPHGWEVHYYDGSVKPGKVYEAVIDMDIGNRDLMQCADSIIRLRAEYLYSRGLYDRISFNFTNGFKADYSSWMQGNRIKVKGNDVSWYRQEDASNDYKSFRSYLDTVITYAGTLSLSKEMKKVEIDDMRPGDVFIKGGSPGHCEIVLDMAENAETGEKLFILAQGYMPAQEMHIVKNPRNNTGNPWYSTDFGDELDTPEWSFTRDQLMRFED
jgi:hypothetical protein